MTKQLVQIVNKVNNAAIRRTRDSRGELVIVVPSFTMVFDSVLNNMLYPASVIESRYMTLNDTPAPVGHPVSVDGEYISANSPEGIIYFQCGIFNKNAQVMEDEKWGKRVYSEMHIHYDTAMKTERGKRVIEAIDRGDPIHTSTGVMVSWDEVSGINKFGDSYERVVNDLVVDHNAVLLDEEGANTPSQGVGIFANHKLFEKVSREGLSMSINTVHTEINQSFNDLREQLQAEVQQRFGEEGRHLWLMDFGDDYAVFELGETPYKVGYTMDGETITLDSEAQEVKRVTMWEAVTNSIKGFFNRGNSATQHQEGNDMFKQHIENVLKANKIDYSKMTDEQMIEAYDTLKGNAAEQPETKGEQSKPKGETVVNAEVQSIVEKAVEKALAANQRAQEQAERTTLADKLKANGVELDEADQASMSVNALRAFVERTSPKPSAYGLAGGQLTNNTNESRFSADLPE